MTRENFDFLTRVSSMVAPLNRNTFFFRNALAESATPTFSVNFCFVGVPQLNSLSCELSNALKPTEIGPW